jgi:Inner membrane protein YgaP-like, transmembrane domain
VQSNVGTIDRILRIVAGIVLISLVFLGPKTAWGWIGVVPIATAFIGFCPAYRLLGIRTTAKKSKQA